MDAKLVEFTHILRRNGVRVSLAENVDSLRATALVGLQDRLLLKDALRATIIKRNIDEPVFDELFDLYFTGLGEAIKGAAESLMGTMQLDEAAFQNLLDNLAEILKDLDIDLSELARNLLTNNTGQLERMRRKRNYKTSSVRSKKVATATAWRRCLESARCRKSSTISRIASARPISIPPCASASCACSNGACRISAI